MAQFNVITYGADNTGASGSKAAIQSAIDAASLAGGGTVYFPPGVYSISGGSLLIPSGVSMIGDGNPRLQVNGGNSLLTLASGATDVVIRGLWLRGDYAGSDGSSSGISISSGAQRVLVEDCRIEEMNFNGIDVNLNNRFVTIRGNHIHSCNVGVSVFKGNSEFFVNENNIRSCRAYGVNVDDATSSDSSGSAIPCAYGSVSGNTISYCAGAGVVVQGGFYIRVSNNTIFNCGQSATTSAHGIIISSGQGDYNRSRDCSVSGNTVTGCTASGLCIQGATRINVTGNTFSDNWQWPSGLTGTPEVDIKKNTVNGSSAISLSGNIIANSCTTNGRSDTGIRINDTASSDCMVGPNQILGYTSAKAIVTYADSGFTRFAGREQWETLPAHSSCMRGRMIHNLTNDKLYLATHTAWVIVGSQS